MILLEIYWTIEDIVALIIVELFILVLIGLWVIIFIQEYCKRKKNKNKQ